jgi:hypothetical protein
VTEAIGEELRVPTLDVEVRAADDARSLNGFDSVVRCTPMLGRFMLRFMSIDLKSRWHLRVEGALAAADDPSRLHGPCGDTDSAGLYLSRHGIGGGFTGVRPVRSHGVSCEALALDFVDDHRERSHNRDCQ